MVLSFTATLEINSRSWRSASYDSSKGDVVMNDWATKVAEKLKEQHENDQLQTTAFLEKQRLKKANGTPRWLQVREAVKKNCEDLNLQMQKTVLTFEVVPNVNMRVRADIDGAHRYLTSSFDADRCLLEWSCDSDSTHGTFGMATTGDGDVVFVQGAVAEPIAPEAIAKKLLNSLLRVNV